MPASTDLDPIVLAAVSDDALLLLRFLPKSLANMCLARETPVGVGGGSLCSESSLVDMLPIDRIDANDYPTIG